MQPVQDLTVEDRVSRTQFQYTLEDPNADELNSFVPKMVARLKELPELRDVATDQQVNGLRVTVVFDRDTASRLGITPSAIDNTLYDAYGQREVSTMFTQLNQYHVVLEVKPGFQNNPVDLRNLFIRSAAGTTGGVWAGIGRIGATRRASDPPAHRWRRPPPAKRLARPQRDRRAALSAAGRRHRHWFSRTEARFR